MPIIDQCRDPYGALSSSRRQLLKQLLQTPDPQLWERARGLIIRAIPVITLEQAVRAVRKQTHMSQVPDIFTLYRALRYAIGTGSENNGICRK